MTRIQSFRIQAKHLFLTYPRCPVPKTECLEHLLHLKYSIKPVYIRVCAEFHDDGTPHLHSLLQFTAKFQTTNPKFFDFVSNNRSTNFHPNVQAAKNAAAVQSYISKDGDYCEHGTFVESLKTRFASDNKDALYSAALATKNKDKALGMIMEGDTKYYFGNYDRLSHNWDRMFQKPPEIYVSPCIGQFNNVPVDLQEWARDNIRDPENRPYRPMSIVIEGQSRLGKTLWSRSLGPHNYYAGHLDMAKHNNDVYYNVIDDVPPKYLKHWKEFFGSQHNWKSNCKYAKPIQIKGGVPTIFLCNSGVDTSYKEYLDRIENVSNKEWTLSNAEFFFVSQSFFSNSSEHQTPTPNSEEEVTEEAT